jgi:hypothetical protein
MSRIALNPSFDRTRPINEVFRESDPRGRFPLFNVLEDTMKKLVFLALVALFIPSLVSAQCAPPGGMHWHSGYIVPETADIFAGQTIGWYELVPCVDDAAATLCVFGADDEGWVFGEDHLLCYGPYDPGCYGFWYLDITAALDAPLDLVNNVEIRLTYCDGDVCMVDCYLAAMPVAVTVVEPPPEIEIFQDTLTNVDLGVNEAFIPFQFCNGDPAADPRDYDYRITSLGYVGPALNTTGELLDVPGGECTYVYGVIDASAASECDYDTLTVIGFFDATGPGGIYDTCVQVIHVIQPLPVPLFTTPVVTIMVLAMVLAAAVIMRRRVTSKA